MSEKQGQTRPPFSNLGPSVLARKEFTAKTKTISKVYLESHRGRRNGPQQKWVQEASYGSKRRVLGTYDKERGKENLLGVGYGTGERKSLTCFQRESAILDFK